MQQLKEKKCRFCLWRLRRWYGLSILNDDEEVFTLGLMVFHVCLTYFLRQMICGFSSQAHVCFYAFYQVNRYSNIKDHNNQHYNFYFVRTRFHLRVRTKFSNIFFYKSLQVLQNLQLYLEIKTWFSKTFLRNKN